MNRFWPELWHFGFMQNFRFQVYLEFPVWVLGHFRFHVFLTILWISVLFFSNFKSEAFDHGGYIIQVLISFWSLNQIFGSHVLCFQNFRSRISVEFMNFGFCFYIICLFAFFQVHIAVHASHAIKYAPGMKFSLPESKWNTYTWRRGIEVIISMNLNVLGLTFFLLLIGIYLNWFRIGCTRPLVDVWGSFPTI